MRILPLFIPFFLAVLVGCSGSPPHHRAHTLMFAEEGQPVTLKDDSPVTLSRVVPEGGGSEDEEVPENTFSSYENETASEFDANLRAVLSGIERSGKKKVLIYIHGGLNTAGSTLQRVDRLLDEAQCKKNVESSARYGCLTDEHYPIFINWRSSLWSSYRDHLFKIRQGERKPLAASLTSPFVFTSDVVSALGSAVPTMAEELADAHTYKWDEDWQNAEGRARSGDLAAEGIDLRLGEDCRACWEKEVDSLKWFPWFVGKVVTLPAIDGFGQEAWEVMLRRTNLLFEPEYREFPRFPGDGSEGDGALSEFFRRLRKVKRKNPELELTLVGHSAGAIILNKVLRHFGDIEFQNIVYMAAACTIEDYQNTIFGGAGQLTSCPCAGKPDCKSPCSDPAGARGYLRRHPQSHVYHLMLQERAEVLDSRWGWFEVIPRGTLLAWIDNFLADPEYRLHRTAGRVYNLLREIERTPIDLRKRIHFKVFDYGQQFSNVQPQEHGGFDTYPFWHEDFWKPSTLPLNNCRSTKGKRR